MHENGDESLRARLANFAEQQPTTAHLAEEAAARAKEAAEAREAFSEFVISGAHAVRDMLEIKDAGYELFPDRTTSHRSNSYVRGYVLRERAKYGSLAWPHDSYFDTYDYGFSANTNAYTRKLVILAETGELAITGYNCQDILIEQDPADSHWFREEAVQSPEDGERLQVVAEADMKATLRKYIARS